MNHIKNLWLLIKSKQYREGQLTHYSLFSVILNKRKLRKNYIKETANRYHNNIIKSKNKGFNPVNHEETSIEYFTKKLKESV